MPDLSDPRPILADSQRSEAVRQQVASFHGDVVAAVRAAVNSQPIVVVGMAQNPHVKRARKGLQAAGLDFVYLEYGSYTKAWRRRLAIKMWTGYSTFPQIFVNGVLIGGNRELQAMLADGSVQAMLADGSGLEQAAS